MSDVTARGAARFAAITLLGCIQSSVREMRKCMKFGHRAEGVETMKGMVQDVYRPMIKRAQIPREAWEWAMKVNG